MSDQVTRSTCFVSRPRELIDLDGVPEEGWRIGADALHLYRGRLWAAVSNGCVLCVETGVGGARRQTLRHVDNDHEYVCLTHGELDEIPYTIRRDFLVRVGPRIERRGSQEFNDMLLIPRLMTQTKRDALLSRLVDAAAQSEEVEGILPGDG